MVSRFFFSFLFSKIILVIFRPWKLTEMHCTRKVGAPSTHAYIKQLSKYLQIDTKLKRLRNPWPYVDFLEIVNDSYG